MLLADAEASRQVLVNADGLYEDHSDFFHTRKGTFGTREQQVTIGREAMNLVREYARAHVHELPAAIEEQLAPSSAWPDAGNRLVYRHLASVLLAPGRPESLRQVADRIVERAVLAGARQRHSSISRFFFRRKAMKELVRGLEATRRQRPETPEDVLAAIAIAADPELDARELAEVFLSFHFAIGGSVGFTLAWSLYLMGRHPEAETRPAWVVREALRLYPVAWLLARRPAREHQIAGEKVGPTDDVIVCPYAVHRNAAHWSEPDVYRPERWGEDYDTQAFLPFGWGPRRCVGASSSMKLVENILEILAERYEMEIELHSDQPQIGAALAPPPFTLKLSPRN